MKINLNRRDYLVGVIGIIIGLSLGILFFTGNKEMVTDHQPEGMASSENSIYTCSMHPQIRKNGPGDCPICAMDLVPLSTLESLGEEAGEGEIQMTEAAMRLADIITAKVVFKAPKKILYLQGKIKPDERRIAQITARFGGRMEELMVNFKGQTVDRGEVLGTIYSPQLITAQKEFIEAKRFEYTNPSFYQAARNKLRLWSLSESQIQGIENRSEPQLFFKVISPMSGTVSKRQVAAGDYVETGSALFEVIDLTKVWVIFDAYEGDLPWIKLGDNIVFTLPSLPGKIFTGNVAYIDPFVDPGTRTIRIRIEVANPQGELKPEMFVKGILESAFNLNDSELIVPKSAVLWTGKKAIVYVKVPNKKIPTFAYREVVLGPEAGKYYVVTGGLEEGEEIAVNGVFRIDASAQLAGKISMMNPQGARKETPHGHSKMGKRKPVEQKPKTLISSLEHRMFRVAGSCGMCKDRIERAALSLTGVDRAVWDQDTKLLKVSFAKNLVTLMAIHKAVAAAGHDTDLVKAPDDVYDQLPECCRYRNN